MAKCTCTYKLLLKYFKKHEIVHASLCEKRKDVKLSKKEQKSP